MAQLIQSEERCSLIHTFQINSGKQFEGSRQEVGLSALTGFFNRQLLSKRSFVYGGTAFRMKRLDFHPFVVPNFVRALCCHGNTDVPHSSQRVHELAQRRNKDFEQMKLSN